MHQEKYALLDIWCKRGTVREETLAGAETHLAARYWNDEEQTRSVMKSDKDGTLWMHTGDEGMMDEEGYLRSKLEESLFLSPV